jgi:hypothetical protein
MKEMPKIICGYGAVGGKDNSAYDTINLFGMGMTL